MRKTRKMASSNFPSNSSLKTSKQFTPTITPSLCSTTASLCLKTLTRSFRSSLLTAYWSATKYKSSRLLPKSSGSPILRKTAWIDIQNAIQSTLRRKITTKCSSIIPSRILLQWLRLTSPRMGRHWVWSQPNGCEYAQGDITRVQWAGGAFLGKAELPILLLAKAKST